MDAESIQKSGVTNHLARAGPSRAEPRESAVREICGTVVPELKIALPSRPLSSSCWAADSHCVRHFALADLPQREFVPVPMDSVVLQ